jgi:hypothetical protein
MGVASLVLGILSIIFGLFVWYLPLLGIILGILGLIMGAVGRSDPRKAGVATGGLVCSIIGLALTVLFWTGCGGCATCQVVYRLGSHLS